MTHDGLLRSILIVVVLLVVLALLGLGQGRQIREDIRVYPARHGAPRDAEHAVSRLDRAIAGLGARIGRLEVQVRNLAVRRPQRGRR